jgi:glycerophosphoryl diester phosphodiesterase
VEADVHRFRGRLEVRHLKTVGPVPILWDRWELRSPFAPRLVLADVLPAVAPGTELMLDLKGRDARLPGAIAAAIEPWRERLRLSVCSRRWSHVEPFVADPRVRAVHSVGSARQLAALRQHFAGRRLEGVSIHERLLDRRVVAELRELADLVVTWPVNTAERAAQLLSWGVGGLITDDAHAVRHVVTA